MDDAAVRGLRLRGRNEQALSFPARAGTDGAVGRLRSSDADGPRPRRRDRPRRGREGRGVHRVDRGRAGPLRGDSAGSRVHVDDDQRYRRDTARAVRGAGPPSGGGRDEPRRHRAERHPQGIHRARHLHLSTRAVDAADHRRLRLLQGRGAALEHHLDLRLSHARGGLHRRAGGGLHDRQRDRLRAGGGGRRPCRRRLRAAALVLLQRAQQSSRRGREVPCRAAVVGAHHAGEVRREGSARARAALSCADGRQHVDGAAAGEQRRACGRAGARRRARRLSVAPHQLERRSAGPADGTGRPRRAPHATDPRARVWGR